ncbi:MAG: prenyltransferase/squalene oxidase repeat-containing protein [Gemmataceae bacterium]
MMVFVRAAAAAVLAIGTAVLMYGPLEGAEKKAGALVAGSVDPATHDVLVERGVAYLKARQAKDGSWSKMNSFGITGLVVYGLLRSGKVTSADESISRGLKWIEGMIEPKDGSIARVPEGQRGFHKNYLTCINLLALERSGLEKYQAVVAAGVKYLRSLQYDEAQEKQKTDPYYGGVGYGPGTRPDMSNTHFFLDAMKAAKVPASDGVYKKALVFVSRCQNLKGEHNDQPWAGKINDGSFIYVLNTGGSRQNKDGAKDKDGAKGKVPPKELPKDAARPGYGSMTYVGLKALADCGLGRADERYTKALEWANKHYTVAENPGLPAGTEANGYYYYLMMMAQCLDQLGIDEVQDSQGKKHDWRAEMVAELAKKQRKDGSWSNQAERWMEGNPDVCTAYALVALSHCKPKTR